MATTSDHLLHEANQFGDIALGDLALAGIANGACNAHDARWVNHTWVSAEVAGDVLLHQVQTTR